MEQQDLQLADVEQALADARRLEDNLRRVALHALQGSWIARLSMYAIGMALVVTLFGVRFLPVVTSALGVAVIVVTLLGQQFRPDVKFVNAKAHILQLTRMITTAERELAAARSGDRAASTPDAILRNIAGVIDEVERNRHLDYAIMRERIVSMMPRDAQVRRA